MSRRIIRLFLASLALAALFAGPVAESIFPRIVDRAQSRPHSEHGPVD